MIASTGWVFEPAHTHITFSVRHLGLTNTPGVFKRFVAHLDFHEQDPAASSVKFDVDVASIDTALEVRDQHLRGPDWFDVQAHPRAAFQSRTVRRTATDRFVIEGDLTLRGLTLPLALEAGLSGKATNPWTQAPVFGFTASGAISRSAYGMGAFPGALSDTVSLRVEAELTRP